MHFLPAAFIYFIFCPFLLIAKSTFKQDTSFLQPLIDTSLHKQVDVSEVVVSAQITPKYIKDVVQNVQIINRQKINQSASNTLQNLLSQQFNTRLTQDNILGSNVSMQGLGGQNIKILVDGIPVIGRLNGSIDLSQINLNNIEKVEIIEGPLSVNYGSDALAGTINLISRNLEKNISEFNSYYESVGHYNIDVLKSLNFEPHFFHFNLGRNFFDGWSKNEQFSILPKKLLADESRFKEWKPKEQIFYNGKYSYRTSYFEFNTNYSGFYEQIVNRGIPREPLFINSFDDYYRTWRKTLLANAKYQFKKSEWNISLSHSAYNRIKNTYFIDLTNLEKNISSNISDQDTSKFRNSIIKSIFKLPAKKNLASEVGIDLNFESAEGRRINSKNQSIADFAIFTNLEWLYRQNLVFRPGLRYAHNTNYDPPLIPSLHLKYSFGLFILRSSFAKGFRSPSLKEQYFNFVDINHNIKGNENLQAENSNNFQFSVDYKKRFNKTSVIDLKTLFFYNILSEKITLASIDDTEYQYVNIGEYKSQGVRAIFEYKFNNLTINYSTSCLGRYNSLSENNKIEQFSYSFDHGVSVNNFFEKLNTSVSLFFKYNDKLISYNLNNSGEIQMGEISGYSIFDFTISRTLFKKLNITFGGKNILNVQSANVLNTSSGVHQSSSNNISVAYGRSFFTSIKWKIR